MDDYEVYEPYEDDLNTWEEDQVFQDAMLEAELDPYCDEIPEDIMCDLYAENFELEGSWF